MKKSVLIVAALGALVLVGCAHREHHKRVPQFETRKNPQVKVVDGRIDAPFVIYFFADEKDVMITWTLPADSQYLFPPRDGIEPEGALTEQNIRQPKEGAEVKAVVLDTRQTELTCDKEQKGGLTFTCTFKNSKPGIYKYTIRVRDPRSGKTLERDPYVMPL